MSNPNNQGAKAPKFSEEYEKGLKVYLKYLPQELQKELEYRGLYDPAFIEQQLGLQHQYDPALAQEQFDALQRRDPQWVAMHGALGDKIQAALERGYLDPRQEAAYNQWAGLAGKVDPRYEAAYSKLAGMAGKGDPTREAEYKALGKQVTGDTLRGATADPETLRQMTQAILSRSPSLSYGEAQNMAAAVYTGQRGQALKQQRQQAGEQFLGQQTSAQQREQSLGSFSQLIDPTRMQQASLGQFYGAAPPEQNVYGLAGTYIQPSNSLVNAENQVGQVQAPRSFGYVNPNAGYQGVQFGLQNYQNQLAQQSGAGGGGGGNPWMQALQGASQGASYGSIGGGYGMAGGAIVGGVAGALGYPQYSDIRTKTDIVKVGEHDGLDVIEFTYKGDCNNARFRGVIAQQVQEKFPDAVGLHGGLLTVDYGKIGLPMLKQCSQCKEFKPMIAFRVTRNQCRVCGKAYKKQWARENRGKYLVACKRTSSRAWTKIMADPVRHAKMRATQNRLRSSPKWRAKMNAAQNRKRQENVNFRIRGYLSSRIGKAIRRQRATKPTSSLLGCSLEALKTHLQKQFREGMAWNNYGKWHIDHIRPCSSFDLLDPKQQRQCFHYTNLQPLWAAENRLKSGQWTESEVR